MKQYIEDFSVFRHIISRAILYSVLVKSEVKLPFILADSKSIESFIYKGERKTFDGRKPRLLNGAFGGTDTPEDKIIDNIKTFVNNCLMNFDFINADYLKYLGTYNKSKVFNFIAKYLTTAEVGSKEQQLQQNIIANDINLNGTELNEYLSSDSVKSVNFAEQENSNVGYIFNPQNSLKTISGSIGGSSKYNGMELIFLVDNYPHYDENLSNFTFYIFNTAVKNRMQSLELAPSKLIPDLCDKDVDAKDFIDADEENSQSLMYHIAQKYKGKDEDMYNFLKCLVNICLNTEHSAKTTIFGDNIKADSEDFKQYIEIVQKNDNIWSKINNGLMTQFGETLCGIYILTSEEYKDKQNLKINFPQDVSQKLFDFFVVFEEDGKEKTHNYSIKAKSNTFGHPIEFDNFVYQIYDYYDNHEDDELYNPYKNEELNNLLKKFLFKIETIKEQNTTTIKNSELLPKGNRYFGKRRFILLNFLSDVYNNEDKTFLKKSFVETFTHPVNKAGQDIYNGFKKLINDEGYTESSFDDYLQTNNSVEDINEALSNIYASVSIKNGTPYIINETLKSKMSHFYKPFQVAVIKELNNRYVNGDENILSKWIHNVLSVDSYQLAVSLKKTTIDYTFTDMNEGDFEFTQHGPTTNQAFEHANLPVHLKKV